MRKKADQGQLSFEEALAGLEQIVTALEKGNLPLAEALKIFEEGMGLAALCTRYLTEAEKKIELLLADKNGKISLKPAQINRDSGEERDEF